jgi:hypothetical protein
MTLLRNPFDPAWGILLTLIQIFWGILLAPDTYIYELIGKRLLQVLGVKNPRSLRYLKTYNT